MACLFYVRNTAPCDHYLSCRTTAGTSPTGSPMEPSFSSRGVFTVLYPPDTRAPISYPPTRRLERSVGPRWMQDPRVANCVMDTLIESEHQWKLCKLSAWVVMPQSCARGVVPF
jgi:hypothetical protein